MPHTHIGGWPDPLLIDIDEPVLPMRGTCYGCPGFPDGHLLVGDPVHHLAAQKNVEAREAAA